MGTPIPYAPADPVADLLINEYGMDPAQAADISARIQNKKAPDSVGLQSEAMARVGKNEVTRMDTLVTNAKRYADIKARRERGEDLQPDEDNFYRAVRSHAIQKMAAAERSPATEQRVDSIRGLGFGAKRQPEDPNDYVYQAMDAAEGGMRQAKQLQAQSTAFRKLGDGTGYDAAQEGMAGGMDGGMQGAGAPSWRSSPAALAAGQGVPTGGYVGADGGEANYDEPPRQMGGGANIPAPQLDIGALLRKRWEEEQLRALLASGVPQ